MRYASCSTCVCVRERDRELTFFACLDTRKRALYLARYLLKIAFLASELKPASYKSTERKGLFANLVVLRCAMLVTRSICATRQVFLFRTITMRDLARATCLC